MPPERLVPTPHGDARLVVRRAKRPIATLVLTHGAGGGIDAPDLVRLARTLPQQEISVTLVEMPWRVQGKKLAPRPPVIDETYLAVVNARGSGPAVRELIGERRRRRVDEIVALAAVLWGVPRDAARTPLLVAGIEGWLGYSEGVIVRWLDDREISRGDVHALLRRALLETLVVCAPSLTTGG